MMKSNILLGLVYMTMWAILISCSEESEMIGKNQSIEEKQDVLVKQNEMLDGTIDGTENVIQESKSVLGIWKIDSIAENDTINVRVLEAFQGFAFRKDSSYAVGKKEYGRTNFKIMGSFLSKKDSLLLLTKKGKIVMRYGLVKSNDTSMVLRGNFEISSNIKKRPTFYLSKDSEIE